MRAREEGIRARRTSFLSHRARYPPSWIAPPFSILALKNISCPCHGVGVESRWATRASNTREYSFEQRTYRSWKTRERGKAMAAQREKGNSLRWRGNQTPVSNVCETFPRSLFWPPDELNELPEVRFEFPFILIGKSTMAFLTGQSWCILKSWYIGGSPDQGLWRCFADGLIQS